MPVLKQYNAASGLWQTVGGMGLPQSPISFSAHKNGITQTLTSVNNEKLTFSTLEKPCPYYDTATSRFTPPAGLYLFIGSFYAETPVTSGIICPILYKNGTDYKFGNIDVTSTSQGSSVACIAYANGTDYFELYGRIVGTGKVVHGASILSYFQACLIPDSYDSTKQIIDLSTATSDYLLGVGETAKITYSAVTSLSLRIKTEEGVYELTIDQPYVTTNSVEGGVGLSPNEATYTNSFVFSESRTDNLVNAVDGAATFTGWRNGATCSNFPIGYPYIMTGSYRISTRTNSKSVTGQCVRLGGTTAPLSMQSEVFAGIWKDTTTVWSSLGKITFPFAQSGTLYIKRVA